MSGSQPPKIRDLAKFKEMRRNLAAFKIMRGSFPVVGPILKLLGINVEDLKESLTQLDELQRQFEELSGLPDDFNDTFLHKGWIIYDFLDLDVAKKAIYIAKANIEEADQFLVGYYTPDVVGMYLQMMQGVRAFRPRMELAEKALIDYAEERYHACIPVVLALMDGLVNELNNVQNLSFSAEDSDLKAWDSITAHEKGLNALKAILFKSRKTTRTETISLPYRHGILHGMDLGYANKTVAAKTWATLFAVRDWAAKAESNQLKEPAPKPQKEWKEIFDTIRKHNEWKEDFEKSIEDWKPRELTVGTDIRRNGSVEDFEKGSPELKLVEFLSYWQKRNYGGMAKCVYSFLRDSDSKMAGRIREIYEEYELLEFELLQVIDQAPAVTEIIVKVEYRFNGRVLSNTPKFRLVINDANDGKPRMRGMSDATWGITNYGYGVLNTSD